MKNQDITQDQYERLMQKQNQELSQDNLRKATSVHALGFDLLECKTQVERKQKEAEMSALTEKQKALKETKLAVKSSLTMINSRTFKTNTSLGTDRNPNPSRYVAGKISTSSSEERQFESAENLREKDMYINVKSTKDKSNMPQGPIKLSNFMQIKLANRLHKDAIEKFQSKVPPIILHNKFEAPQEIFKKF